MSFFKTILRFTQPHLEALGDVAAKQPIDPVNIDGFVLLKGFVPGTYKTKKPNKITGTDKIHLKCDYKKKQMSMVSEKLICFALEKPPVLEIYKEPRSKFFKKVNKSV